jgi:hypothetical protein
MSATITPTAVNGLLLLEAVRFEFRLFASIVAQRKDWEQILDSIPAGQLRRNAAGAIFEIRRALGLEAAYALDICQGQGNIRPSEAPEEKL